MLQTRYQLDPTGISPNNLVASELHAARQFSFTVIIPTYGAYFTDSLVVYNTANASVPLVRGTDYICMELVEDATAKYGKEICQLIYLNPNINITQVSINYQCLGGLYEYQTSNIENLYYNAMTSSQQAQSQVVDWYANVINKPNLYTPTNHINMLEDIYGFEPLVYAIERLRNVLQLTNTASYQNLVDYLINKFGTEVTKPQMDQGLNVTNFVGLDALLYFLENFAGDSTFTITPKTITANSYDLSLATTNLPNGFRLFWTLIDPTDATVVFTPNTGKFNVDVINNSYDISFTSNKIPSSDAKLSIRFFSYQGPEVFVYQINSFQTSVPVTLTCQNQSTFGTASSNNLTTI